MKLKIEKDIQKKDTIKEDIKKMEIGDSFELTKYKTWPHIVAKDIGIVIVGIKTEAGYRYWRKK